MPRNFLKFCKIQRKYLLFVIWRGSIGTKGFDTQRNPKKMLKNKKPKMDFLTLLEATPGFEPGIRVLQRPTLCKTLSTIQPETIGITGICFFYFLYYLSASIFTCHHFLYSATNLPHLFFLG